MRIDDEWLARRGQSRQKKCALCANFGRAYPLGGYQTAICETCIVTKQLTAFTTDSLERLLEASRRVLPTPEELPPASEDWEKCIACSKGDNTVGHWIRWCVVPISALRSLTGDDSIQYVLRAQPTNPSFQDASKVSLTCGLHAGSTVCT